MPFIAREVLPALEEIGTDQEEAAHTLGASSWQTFWRVTLPSIRWSLLACLAIVTLVLKHLLERSTEARHGGH